MSFLWVPFLIAVAAAAFAAGRRTARSASGPDEAPMVENAAPADEPAAANGSATPIAISAHELRTPVAGIAGMAGLLMGTDLTPEQKTYVEAIRHSGEAALELLDGILGDAAAEAEGTVMPVAPFSPALLAERAVELLAPRAFARGIEIAAFVDHDVPAEVVGEAGRLRQIVLNLLGNAIKFTHAGGVGLRVERRGASLSFTVHDTGPGIAPDVATRLFERFQRGDQAQTGAGLGLPISREIAESMGGTIDFHTRPGAGSAFSVTVPVRFSHEDAREDDPDLSGEAMLIVGRSPFEMPWMAEALGRAGAAIVLAGDGGEAEKMLARRKFTSAILHHELDGLAELVHRLKREDMRVIGLVTPAARHGGAREDFALFDNYLMKPVRTATLLAVAAGTVGEESGHGAEPAATDAPARRVLLAEDDAVNALLARVHLERLGYRAMQVGDGAAAVSAFGRAIDEGRPFDLVVMDLALPGIGGIEAAEIGRVHV